MASGIETQSARLKINRKAACIRDDLTASPYFFNGADRFRGHHSILASASQLRQRESSHESSRKAGHSDGGLRGMERDYFAARGANGSVAHSRVAHPGLTARLLALRSAPRRRSGRSRDHRDLFESGVALDPRSTRSGGGAINSGGRSPKSAGVLQSRLRDRREYGGNNHRLQFHRGLGSDGASSIAAETHGGAREPPVRGSRYRVERMANRGIGPARHLSRDCFAG